MQGYKQMKSFREFIAEKAPPSKEAEEWIKANKEEFKKQYGDDWEKVLYAKAWKMFGEKKNIDEKSFYQSITDYMNRKMFNTKTYKMAFDELDKVFSVKKGGDLLSTAQKIAKSYRGVDYRELAAMYVDAYPQYADEIAAKDKSAFDYNAGSYI